MPADLPYAADADASLSYDELEVLYIPSSWHSELISLQVLRLQYQKERAQSHVTVQTKFNYAWGLVKSQTRECQVEGIQLLQGDYISVLGTSNVHIHFRYLSGGTIATSRVSVLHRIGILQDGQLP